jgi:hypothetical protein
MEAANAMGILARDLSGAHMRSQSLMQRILPLERGLQRRWRLLARKAAYATEELTCWTVPDVYTTDSDHGEDGCGEEKRREGVAGRSEVVRGGAGASVS